MIAEYNDVNFTIGKVNTVAHPKLAKKYEGRGGQHCFCFAVEVVASSIPYVELKHFIADS